MKRMKIFCLMFVLGCIFNCQNVHAASAETLYKQFLSHKYIYAEGNYYTPTWYSVIDIDKKGPKELIIKEVFNGESIDYIYTVANNKVYYCGRIHNRGWIYGTPTFLYSKKWKSLVTKVSMENGDYSCGFEKLINRNIVMKYAYGKTRKPKIYEIGTKFKKVSKKKYNKYVKKYYKKGKVTKYKFKKNNYIK